MAKLKADSDRGSIYSEALAEAVTAMAGLVTKSLASNKQAEEEAAELSFLFTFEGSKDNPEDKVAHEVRTSMRPFRGDWKARWKSLGRHAKPVRQGLSYEVLGSIWQSTSPQWWSSRGTIEAKISHNLGNFRLVVTISFFAFLAWPTKELLMIPQPSEKPVWRLCFMIAAYMFYPVVVKSNEMGRNLFWLPSLNSNHWPIANFRSVTWTKLHLDLQKNNLSRSFEGELTNTIKHWKRL